MISNSAKLAMKRVEQYLEESDLSQKDFAITIGIARPTLNKYMQLEMEPSLAALEKIAKGMRTTVSALVGETTPARPSPEMIAALAAEALHEWATLRASAPPRPSLTAEIRDLADRLAALHEDQRRPLVAALRAGIDSLPLEGHTKLPGKHVK